MSKTVDSRVVEMTFDNKQFEKGISQSMSSIDSLDKKLKKGESTDSMGTLGKAVDQVSVKFSALQAMAFGALADIGKNIKNEFTGLVKSLSTDQIKAGFDKYSDKTTAMQTIVNATIGEEETMEEATDRVSEALDRLNWFTDETSYNFTDMVGNIGKFTAAGVDLNKSISAMEGIATWAGISGAGMQQASSAMYNFSQAMGSGAMMAQDWKSIENANMATKEFKETAIETAAELGYLSKTFDSTGKAIYKTEKGTEVTAENFRSTLAEKWFSSDVMTATLNQYGGFADKLSETMDMVGDSDLTTSRVIEWIDDYNAAVGDSTKQQQMLVDAYKDWEFSGTLEEFSEQMKMLASDEYDLGRRSFKAAQEAKTFQEAIDATKDAVSTGWMNIFEKIFGNYYESKELWTELANRMYEAFMPGVTGINDTLDAWRGMEDSSASLYYAIDRIKDANENVSSDQIQSWMERYAEAAGDAAKQDEILAEAHEATKMSTEDLRNTFEHIATAEEKLGMGGREDLIQSFWNLWDAISNIKEVASMAWREIFGAPKDADESAKSLTAFIKRLQEVTANFKDLFYNEGFLTSSGSTLKSIFKGLFSIIKIGKNVVKLLLAPFKALAKVIGNRTDGLGTSIFVMTAKIGDSITAFSEWLEETDLVQKATDKLVEVFTWVADKIGILAEKVSTFVEESGALDWITSKWESLKDTLRNFNKDTDGDKQILTWTDFINKLKDGLEAIAQKLRPVFEFIKKIASAIGDKLKPVLESIKKAYKENGGLKGIFDLFLKGALFANILQIITFLSTIKKSIKKASSGFGDLLDSFGNAIDGFAKNQRAEAMKKMAESVLIMVIAVTAMALVIHFLGPEVNEALFNVVLLMISLGLVMKVAGDSVKNLGNAAGMAAMAAGIAAFGAALVVLVAAVVIMALLPTEKVEQGLLSISVLILLMAVVLKSLNKNLTSSIEGAAAIIAFAKGIKILTKAVTNLAKLENDSLIRGIEAVVVLMAAMVLTLQVLNGKNFDIKSIGILLGAVLGIKMLVTTIAILGNMKPKALIQGVAAVGVLLLALAGFLALVKETGGNMISTAFSLMLLASALNMLIIPIAAFGMMDPISLGQGMLAVAALLTAMVLALDNIDAESVIAKSGALVILAAAIDLLVPAIVILSTIDFLSMLGGLAGIVVVLAALVGAITLLSKNADGALKASLAILAIGAGLALIGVGMAAFAAGLATLVALGTPAIVMLGLLGAAIVAFIALLIVEVAAAFVKVLEVIATNMPSVVNSITIILDGILEILKNSIPAIIEIIGLLCIGLVEILQALVPTIVDIVGIIISGVLDLVKENLPKIIEIIGIIIDGVFKLINENVPKLTDTLRLIVRELLDLVVDLASDFIETIQELLDIVGKWITNDLIPWAVNFVFDVILSFLTSLDEALRTDLGSIVEMFLLCIIDLFYGIIKGIADFITNERTKEVFGKVWEAIRQFFIDVWAAIKETYYKVKESIVGWISSIKEWFSEKAEKVKNAVKEFFQNGIKDGINAAITKIKEAVKGIIDKIKNIFKGKDPDVDADLTDSGKNLTEGIAVGLEDSSALGKVKTAVQGIANKIKSWFDTEEDINSPSKEFALRGRYIDEGLAEGVTEYSKIAKEATKDLADDTLDTMSGLISAISKSIDSEEDFNPTITPVLDLSQVQNGRKLLNGMFDSKTIGLTAETYNSSRESKNSTSSDISSAINSAFKKYSDEIIYAIKQSSSDTDVNISLTGDAGSLFKMIRTQNSKYKASTGRSAFV